MLNQDKEDRRVIHISVGSSDWVPTKKDLKKIKDSFEKADKFNKYVVTRSGVVIMSVI